MTVAATEVQAANPLDPQWWVGRLYDALQLKLPEIDFYDAYYSGDHPLPWVTPEYREEAARILAMCRANVLGLVCDATAERIHVEGFRFGGETQSDEDTWGIWQHNNLDADSDIAWLESLICGSSFFMVEPNSLDRAKPKVWVESAKQCIVEYEPGTNRRERRAGLKVFKDDWTGLLMATLFLATPKNPSDANSEKEVRVYKYEAPAPRAGVTGASSKPEWKPRQVPGETWGDLAGVPRVPIIEIANNPRLLTGGRSELYDLTDGQDRINKTLIDRLMTQDFGAFPQWMFSGWPQADEAGNPTPPIEIGRNRVITTDVQETRFQQAKPADLGGYSEAKREDVKDIASRSRTPAQYLLGEMSNVNGETLKASESGLVAKVRQRMRPFSEAAEEAMRMARELAGLAGDNEMMMETIFRNPEFRTEGEVTDAAVKKLSVGIASKRQARVDVGYSETEIRNLEEDDRREALDPMIANVLRPVAAEVAASGESGGGGGGGGVIAAPGARLPRDRDRDGVAGER